MGGRRRIAALSVAVAAVFGGFGVACGNPTLDVKGCVGASDEVIEAVSAKLTVDGKLRNGKEVADRADGYTFVSAELHLPDDDKHDQGDILTWATKDLDGGEFESVDVQARENSSWPEAAFDVRVDGARESRACSDLQRGKTKAQLKCEQDESEGINTGIDKDCGDL